jgi:hypothetical protein
MSSNDSDIYDRLRALEQLVRHLYKQTGVPMPDPQSLATTEVSDHVRQLAASGNKMGAIKAYRDETGIDLRSAQQVVESLYRG